MEILITGFAGFIGYHVTNSFLKNKKVTKIIAIDNFNNYYDIKLKKDRVSNLKKIDKNKKLLISKIDLKNFKKLHEFTKDHNIKFIIHLAAQAGIRYSFVNPRSYIDSNINGFFNVLEIAKIFNIKNLIYASSSSVYGSNSSSPFKESSVTNEPLQLYAATKTSNEVMAHAYSHSFNIKTTGLRFFTVYGPYGRPDMAIYKFVEALSKNKKFYLYDKGKMLRDFTYIDDIVKGIVAIFNEDNNTRSKKINYNKIYNLGRGMPVKTIDLIKKIEKIYGKKGKIIFKNSNNSEMSKTHCSINKFKRDYNFIPKTNLDTGLELFINWYKAYYKIK